MCNSASKKYPHTGTHCRGCHGIGGQATKYPTKLLTSESNPLDATSRRQKMCVLVSRINSFLSVYMAEGVGMWDWREVNDSELLCGNLNYYTLFYSDFTGLLIQELPYLHISKKENERTVESRFFIINRRLATIDFEGSNFTIYTHLEIVKKYFGGSTKPIVQTFRISPTICWENHGVSLNPIRYCIIWKAAWKKKLMVCITFNAYTSRLTTGEYSGTLKKVISAII